MFVFFVLTSVFEWYLNMWLCSQWFIPWDLFVTFYSKYIFVLTHFAALVIKTRSFLDSILAINSSPILNIPLLTTFFNINIIKPLSDALEIYYKWDISPFFFDLFNTKKLRSEITLKGHGTNSQKQPPEVFCKKSVLTNFAKFTGKHLC